MLPVLSGAGDFTLGGVGLEGAVLTSGAVTTGAFRFRVGPG